MILWAVILNDSTVVDRSWLGKSVGIGKQGRRLLLQISQPFFIFGHFAFDDVPVV